jgi:2-polyprenyl-6-methoxyphenol hydroxylase-like FAD-dependent oxidoreductase
VLDPILADAAQRAGAEVMMGTTVVSLVGGGSRRCGVRIQQAGGERVLRARLVVGADGRNSTVARLVNARKYNVVPSERFAYWSFFDGVDPGPDPGIVYHRWAGRLVIATPADGGLYEVIVIPDEQFRAEFAADRERAFMDHAMACAPVAEALRGARRVGKLYGIKRWEGFFRESAGPGWALVGDAGHFKDPAPGQGMTDAFRQAEALAPAIVTGMARSDAQLDVAVADWARWRDRDAGEHHWLAADFGAAGPAPAVVPEMMRRLDRSDRMSDVLDLLQHRAVPSAVFTPGRLAAATASLMAQTGTDRRVVLREVGGLLRQDIRRRRLMRKPAFVGPEAHQDAGETDVPESLVTA